MRFLGSGPYLALAALAAAANGQPAPASSRRAVGLLLKANDASLLRSGAGLQPGARGSLLFAGDTVITAGTGLAEAAWCKPGAAPVVYSISGSASLRMEDPPVGTGTPRPLPFCELPELPPAEASFQRPTEPLAPDAAPQALPDDVLRELSAEDQQKLRLIQDALAADPANLLALVSRASLLARAGKSREASGGFALLDRALSVEGQGWAKEMLVETASKSRAVESTPHDSYAVVVGISNYPDARFKLRFARRDAERMREFLLTPRGGSIKESNIAALFDRQAGRAQVQQALEKAFRRKAARVVVFLSAHGILVNNKPYLVTWDCQVGNAPEKCYPMSELIGLIRLYQPNIGRVELYVDACRLAHPDPVSEPNRVNTNVAAVLDAIPGKRIALFASAETAYEHQVFDDGKGDGAFTYHLLKGLNDPPESSRSGDTITLGELIRFIGQGVPETTRKHQYPADRVSELSKPAEVAARFGPGMTGIAVGGTTIMPADAFKAPKGEADFGRLPATAEGASGWVEAESKSLEILQRYLDGDEVPQKQEDFQQGANYTAEALRLAPDSAELAARLEFFEARALLFEVTNPGQDAAKLARIRQKLEKAIRLDPASATAYNALGIVYLRQAEFDKAKDYFDAAIQRSPYWAYPKHNRALALSEKGDYAGAEQNYLLAIRQASAFSYLPYNLGLLYQRMNRKSEARRAYHCAGYLIKVRAAGGRIDFRSRKKAGCPEGESLFAPRSVRMAVGQGDNPVRIAAPRLALGVLRSDSKAIRDVVATLEQTPTNPDVARYLAVARHDLAVVLARKRSGTSEAEAIWTQLSAADYAPSRLALADYLLDRARKARGAARAEMLARAGEQYRTLASQQPQNNEMVLRLKQVEVEKERKR